jgi:hypothetical protein
MRKIKAMGELEEREVPADIRVRNVFITVEILSNR